MLILLLRKSNEASASCGEETQENRRTERDTQGKYENSAGHLFVVTLNLVFSVSLKMKTNVGEIKVFY